MAKEEKINQLKIEIFGIIREQDLLKLRFNQLNEIKTQKLNELTKLEEKKK